MFRMEDKEKEELFKKVHQISKDLERVLFILNSDKSTNTKGAVEKISDLRSDVDLLIMKEKIFHTKVITYAGVASTSILIIAWIGDKIIKLLTNN